MITIIYELDDEGFDEFCDGGVLTDNGRVPLGELSDEDLKEFFAYNEDAWDAMVLKEIKTSNGRHIKVGE